MVVVVEEAVVVAVAVAVAAVTWTKRSAPGVRSIDSRYTVPNTESGSPFRCSQRWRRLSSKSISPRIAASVTADTSSYLPARRASSSITSCWMMVLSMSRTTSRFERRSSVSRCSATSHWSAWRSSIRLSRSWTRRSDAFESVSATAGSTRNSTAVMFGAGEPVRSHHDVEPGTGAAPAPPSCCSVDSRRIFEMLKPVSVAVRATAAISLKPSSCESSVTTRPCGARSACAAARSSRLTTSNSMCRSSRRERSSTERMNEPSVVPSGIETRK